MTKVAYKPLGFAFSVLGGILAGSLFKAVWRKVAKEDEAPRADEAGRSWREVLIAATLQGAVFGLVKAAVDRAGAVGFARATGSWPGESDSREAA